MKTARLEKKFSPLTACPANGLASLTDADGRDFSIVWEKARAPHTFNGLTGNKVRFEITQGKYSFSLYDVTAPVGYRFIDNFDSFTDATESALEVLIMEDAQVIRARTRNAALTAMLELSLTA